MYIYRPNRNASKMPDEMIPILLFIIGIVLIIALVRLFTGKIDTIYYSTTPRVTYPGYYPGYYF